MDMIEKKNLNLLRSQLKSVKGELEEKRKILDYYFSAKSSRKLIKYNNDESMDEQERIINDTLNVINRALNGIDSLISMLPNFGNEMLFSGINHDLPLLFVNFDEDVVTEEKNHLYNVISQISGLDISRLLSGNILYDDNKRQANFLSCYLMLSGLKRNALSDESIEKFLSNIGKMEKCRQAYIESCKNKRIGSSINIDPDNLIAILNEICDKYESGKASITDDEVETLKQSLLSDEIFSYAFAFIFFNIPAYRLLTKELSDEEIIECFEHFLAKFISYDNFLVDENYLEIFKLLYSNYINFYMSHINHIFDDLKLEKLGSNRKKLFVDLEQANSICRRCSNKIRELMSYYLDIQHEFIVNNNDILKGIRKENVMRISHGDNSTYTDAAVVIDEPIKEKEKTDVYSSRLSSFENILNGDVFAHMIAIMLQSGDVELLSFFGVDEIPSNNEELKNMLTKVHNLFKDIYMSSHNIASESKNGTLSVYKDGHFLELQPLADVDTAIELYSESTSDDDRKELIEEIINNLKKLKVELDKLVPVDNSEHNVIYYTVPVSKRDIKNQRYDAEDICIMKDIESLRKAGLGSTIQSCLQTIHDAFLDDNIDGLASSSKPIKGTNGINVYVKNKKVIFTVAEYNVNGKHTKKVIILGAGNDANIFGRAQCIANSVEFRRFYDAVCQDCNYSQPLDYADQVFKACSKGKAKTND